ncbi:glycoside hydrolase family 2 protein [Acidomyces richmondensis BFW]|nr:MAG: glycoside hydrolase family 2 protein [Acidomyces sp. 'richmondensis']KYG50397.1 glycoside hydrolase family 2 protein [Acidomyces richmondensis BFW]
MEIQGSLSPLTDFAPPVAFSPAHRVVNLSGLSGWILHNANHSISVPAQLPSEQYQDLYSAGVIADPLYGFNDSIEEWVQMTNWTYTSPILAGLHSSDDGSQIWLVFEGLDTFTSIEICNKTIGKTNNQFRQYLFDVTSALDSCTEPRLSVAFFSAAEVAYATSTSSRAQPKWNEINSCSADNKLGCKIYARKEQNDFGWDWSPSLVPAGPWRPIYAVQLTCQSPVYVTNTLIDIYREGQLNNMPPNQIVPWVFNASLDFIGELPNGASLQLTLTDVHNNTILKRLLCGVYISNMTITGSTTIDDSKVQLWWPSGFGEQPLYYARIDVIDGDKNEITAIERRVGFRTIVLNLNPVTEVQQSAGIAPGSNWHFEINGDEIYCKGSNFVPPDVFWPRANETRIRRLFEFVVKGNQNMLRVWSSGAYLADWIYNMADEMGILLWSEFQFSDAEYPTDQSYLANYEAEVYYNVRHLNNHPSLAVWVGGNELEQIQLAYFFNATSPKEIMLQYQLVFEEILIKCVYANTRSISYIPSSTYNGYLRLDFNSTRPQLPRYENRSSTEAIYSDTDYYNYDATQAFNLSSYPIGRFANEFGFHSMPSLQSWETEVTPDQFYLTSPAVVHHNRHYPFGISNKTITERSLAGIAEMTDAVRLWYPTPQLSSPAANFSAWIYATQVFQADFYQHQIAFYRRGSGLPERQLGSLYWQLEDLWVAPTWSSIEATGRQKLIYYAAKDIYRPVIGYGYYNISTYELQVWVTSDLSREVVATATLDWFDWNGQPLSIKAEGPNYEQPYIRNASQIATVKVGPINSTQVFRYSNLIESLQAKGHLPTNAILRLSVLGRFMGEVYLHTSFFTVPGSLANTTLPDPGLVLVQTPAAHGRTASIQGSETSNIVIFDITATKATAAWVWLNYQTNAVTGYWSENGFWLAKGETKTVYFTVWEDWSSGKWVQTVEVRSLWNNTRTSK